MSRKYFGTDGIRGRVGESPITPDFVLRLAYAAGGVFGRREHGNHPAVLIGKDTRVSGYMLEAALEAGFTAAGVDVRLTGPMPTAGIAYLTRALRLSVGVVISASHNSYQDNGIKFFSADGSKLPDAVERDIESRLDEPLTCVQSEALGKAQRIEDAAGRYTEFCKSTFPQDLSLRGLRIVVDCAHGAAYEIAPHVFHELGAEVVTIGASPNGFNINEACGATHPEALQLAVRSHRADLGVSLDGDADRVVMADGKGRIYNGDELLYVLVADGIAQGKSSGVAGTLMTNFAVEKAFERLGVPFARAKVGDRYVLETLLENSWIWGGESSGHLLCLDRHSTGDGIISALQIISAMQRSGKSLAELTSAVKLYPQKLINVRIPKDFDWSTHPPLLEARREVEGQLGESGRVLIRASGTEPVLRVMVEAETEKQAREAAEKLAASLPKAA
ncbi:MAG: phosphoglucosamine mutase [Burkholderiaceae bacterium]|jgi:phosphoglucosamine mutase